MCYDPQNGNLHYVHANTEDRKGDAAYTADVILGDLVKEGVLTATQEATIRDQMGSMLKGSVIS